MGRHFLDELEEGVIDIGRYGLTSTCSFTAAACPGLEEAKLVK